MRRGSGAGFLLVALAVYIFLLWRDGRVWLPRGQTIKRDVQPLGYWSIMVTLAVAFLAVAYLTVAAIIRAALPPPN